MTTRLDQFEALLQSAHACGHELAAGRDLAPHFIRLARVADDCADKLALLRDLSDTEAYVSRALNAALAPLLAEVPDA